MRSLADLMRNFLQIGYVTDDIDAAASYLESRFGTIECVKHFTSSLGRGNPDAAPGSFVVVDGVTAEEWLIDVALVNAGATNLEIIRPRDGAVDLYRGGAGADGWLLGLSAAKVNSRNPAVLTEFGHLVETFAVGEILKQVSWSDEVTTASHFRTETGDEVDLVLETWDGRSPVSRSRAAPGSRTRT